MKPCWLRPMTSLYSRCCSTGVALILFRRVSIWLNFGFVLEKVLIIQGCAGMADQYLHRIKAFSASHITSHNNQDNCSQLTKGIYPWPYGNMLNIWSWRKRKEGREDIQSDGICFPTWPLCVMEPWITGDSQTLALVDSQTPGKEWINYFHFFLLWRAFALSIKLFLSQSMNFLTFILLTLPSQWWRSDQAAVWCLLES